MSAEALIERQTAAVVNVAASISGRYPNYGPQLLMEAGIPLVVEAGLCLPKVARPSSPSSFAGAASFAGAPS